MFIYNNNFEINLFEHYRNFFMDAEQEKQYKDFKNSVIAQKFKT